MKINQRKSLKLSFNIGFSLCCLAFFAQSALAATYYIDSSRPDDSGNGLSQGAAWKTIDKVNKSTFQPGDNILFKKGQSWHEQLTVPSSGSNGNPITFGAYGTGANPKIYRTDTFASWWEHSLIPNGGFEAYEIGTPNDSFYFPSGGAGWHSNSSNEPNGYIKADTDAPLTGLSSVHLHGDQAGHTGRWSGYEADCYQYLTLTGGTTYYLSVKGKRADADNDTLLVKIRDQSASPVQYLKSDGSWTTTPTTAVMDWSESAQGQWLQKNLTFNAYGTGSRDIQFQLLNEGTGDSYVDDVYLIAGNAPSPTKIWAGTLKHGLTIDYWGMMRSNSRVFKKVEFPRDDPLTSMTDGYFYAPLTSSVFYFRQDSGSPGAVEIGARESAIAVNSKNYVVIDGIDCLGPGGSDTGNETNHAGIVEIAGTSDHVVVKNADISYGSTFGIESRGGEANLGHATTNVEFRSLAAHDSMSTQIYNNSTGGGVYNCKVYNVGLLETDGGDMGGIGLQGSNLTIDGNELYNIGRVSAENLDFAISSWGASSPNYITRNYIHNIPGCGIGVAYGGDNSVIANNIINVFGYGKAGWSSHLSGIRVGGTGDWGDKILAGPKMAKIYNNVISGGLAPRTYTEAAIFVDSGDYSGLVARNNIIHNNTCLNVSVSGGAITTGDIFDHNIYSDPARAWYWKGATSNDLANDLAEWRSVSGMTETGTLTSNPLFTNASGNFSRASDFQLSSNSPAKDAGTDVSLTTDYAGTSIPQNSVPDIGAYEYAITYSAADINRDESINLSDFNILKTDFMKLAASLANSRSDINGDGQATIKDIGILMSGWKL